MRSADPDPVSPREAEVLALLSAHLSNAQIAGRLHISVRTVENHVSSLLRKYGAADRRALAIATATAGRGQAARPPDEPAGGPGWHTTFIGRSLERDTILGLFGSARLVTLTGPGGVGKTRLAAAVAAAAASSFESGAAFADLVPVRQAQVIQAVATALNVTERTGQPLAAAVAARLAHGRRLLILDNCEHVLDDAAAFADLALASSADVTVLATSRERLGVPGERVVPLSPLPLASDAEALFAERAKAVDPGFAADPAVVARICARLDGMPLAVELAAARYASLGADGLLAALDDTVRLLSGGRGRDERHRSLRAVLGWSHDLLSDAERALFRRLAVFAGNFDIDAATAVAGGSNGEIADLVGRLADKSLIVRQRADGRWRLLATVRAFAVEQLAASGEAADVHGRHLRWAAETAGALEGRLGGDWRDGFDAAAGDLRAALAQGEAVPDAVAHRLARSLGHLTYARRFFTEALGHFEDAARRAPTPLEAAADLRTAAQAVFAVGLAGRAFDLLLASADQAAAAGDRNAEAVALADAVSAACRFTSGFREPVPGRQLDRLLARAGVGGPLSPAADARLRLAAAAVSAYQDAVPGPAQLTVAEAAADGARAVGDPVLVSGSLDTLAAVAAQAGQFRRACSLADERLALLDAVDRNQPQAAAEVLSTLHGAWVGALAVGDLPKALAIARRYADDDLLGAHPYRPASKLIPPLALMGRFDEALSYAEPMWDAWQQSGAPVAVWLSAAASAAALAHGLRGDMAGFRRWRTRAQRAAGPPNPALAFNVDTFALFVDTRVTAHAGAEASPADLIARAFAPATRGWHQAYARAAAAELAALARLPEAGQRLTAALPSAQENDWARACVARTRGLLRGDTASLQESAERWRHIAADFERTCTLDLLNRALRVEREAPGLFRQRSRNCAPTHGHSSSGCGTTTRLPS